MKRTDRRAARRLVGWIGIALTVAACNNAESTPAAPAPTRAPVSVMPRTSELLGALAAFVGQISPPGNLIERAAQIDSGQSSLDDYIDELLRSERFASETIPDLVFGAYGSVRTYYAVPAAFVLKRSGTNGPLYLRAPCTAEEAVTVRPWWDFSSEVKVCPDAHRPEKWTMTAAEHSYKTSTVLSCDSQIGSPELETASLCGCGPNLIRCLRDDEQYNELSRSMMDEVKRTTAYVVEHDLPIATLFTTNATFRDRNVELYYRRQKIGALESSKVERELRGLADWPEGGAWAPRDEVRAGQHAGVLTTPQILHWLPDRRQRQRAYYEIMWCNLRNSFGATTAKVLEINGSGNNFLAHDSWKKLAHTELCTNCHARLDYGSRFFMGYPDSRASIHFTPELQSAESGPLYGQDISDLRGSAQLTPQGFARLATEQPDFKGCMSNHFVDYVLGDRATAEDIKAIEDAVEKTGTFKPAMKVALERYAVHWKEKAPVQAPVPAQVMPFPGRVAPAPAPAPGGGVTLSPALRETLDRYCVDCHDASADTGPANLSVNLMGTELPRPLLVRMTDQVAFGMMPKAGRLEMQTREDVVRLLIDTLWTESSARQEAERYYVGGARGLPAHQIDNTLSTIAQIAKVTTESSWGALERGIWSDQATITPGFLAVTGLEAVRACQLAAQSRTVQLEDCLGEATSLNVLSRWPPPAPPRAHP